MAEETASVSVHCLACGELVPVWFGYRGPILCERCKKAILHMRDILEKEEAEVK